MYPASSQWLKSDQKKTSTTKEEPLSFLVQPRDEISTKAPPILDHLFCNPSTEQLQPPKMADSSDIVPPWTHVCKGDETCLDVPGAHDGDDEEENALMQAFCEESPVLESDDEHIELLLSRESCFCSRARDASSENNSIESARSDAVRWILQAKAFFGFGMTTAYVAVSYFDRFLMHRTIDLMDGKSWAIQLLSVACLSLAVKMEEHEAPALSDFQTGDYRFNAEAIQRMELLVLSTLEWRMSAVTPFSYLRYFASKFQEHGSECLIGKAIKLIFASIEVMRSLMDYPPSVIAAAAILAATDERSTQKSVKSKMSTISSCRSLDTDHVFSCYSLMIKEKLQPSKYLATSNQSEANCSSVNNSVDANGTISFMEAISKRRRLQ